MNDTLYWVVLISIFAFGWGVGRMDPPPAMPQPEVNGVIR